MFEIKNLSKKYTSEYAIKSLNMEIGSGLNFIIGPSGSGKTTLLKIIIGLDNKFEGEVLYFGESIKNLTEDQKSYHYNNKFGLIWQDFNLIEDMTVEENILIPLQIKNVDSKNELEKVLRKLKIVNLRNKKVKLLSGGQKQKVAIARELVKNPEVIIADEPTSALDYKSSQEVIQILKEISKDRTIIIVTHNSDLIDDKAKVYELDKGELISKPQNIETKIKGNNQNSKTKFKFLKALKVGKINIKSKISRTLVSCLSIVFSSVLLMSSLGGTISRSGEESFKKLFKEYGNSILDINIVKSFTSASGTDDDEPKSDVEQDINGLYDKYINDKRVDYLLFVKSLENISVEVEGKKYSINGSGTLPSVNEIILGNNPKNKGEVLVPQSFVKSMGISNEEAIGKEIDFSCGIYNWDSGKPELKNINVKAKIVGVANTKLSQNFEGESYEFELEDSFFFDKETLDEVNKQAGIDSKNHDFVLRTKNPNSLIEIKNEINAKGIVPIGQFELVEDIVNLNSQTNNLSQNSIMLISALAVIGVVAISLVTSFIRKREYAIYKVCGYSKSQLSLVSLAENSMIAVVASMLIVVLSPAISIFTQMAFGAGTLNIKSILIGISMSFILSFILHTVSSEVGKNSDPLLILKSGVR